MGLGDALREPRDRLALAVLVAIPLLEYVPAAIAGRLVLGGIPVVGGDNLFQNYPLRVYAGELLRHGHLPLWDPYVWSGTPLLAGWNAGAMYPATWLFAVIPAAAAWTVNSVLPPIICGTGTYLFLRRMPSSPLAAFLGAAVFTFAGFMAGQSVHLGLVEAVCFLPWMLIAVDELAVASAARSAPRRRDIWSAPWPPVLLLAVAAALALLAGDPRGITNDAIAVTVFAVWRFVTVPACRRGLVAGLAVAGFVAVGLSATQWLPGVHFFEISERGTAGYSFYIAGSLSPRYLVLALAPFLLGGYGNFGLPAYAGSYNLPELSFGLGVLPLVAAFALAGRRALRRTSSTAVWYVLLVVGLVLALGGETPAGHAFALVPLFGGQRLQSRNAALIDFALAALLALFVDRLELRESDRVRGSIPVALTLVLIAAANVFEGSVETMFDVNPPVSGLFHSLAPVLVPTAAIALAAGAVLALYPRLSPKARRAAFSAIALADLALIFANQSFISEPISLLASSNPVASAVGRAAGPEGRFAIYNPLLLQAGAGNAVGIEAGASDLSVLHAALNAGGYGSLLDGSYATWTGSHPAETVSPAALAGVVFDELDLRALLTLSPYLATRLPPGVPATPACAARGRAPVMPCALPRTAFPAGTLRYAFPGRERVTSAGVLIDPSDPRGRVRVGILAAGGRIAWAGTVGASPDGLPVQIRLARPSRPAVGLVVENEQPLPVSVDLVTAGLRDGTTLELNGPLQGGLDPRHWRYAGRIGPYVVFDNSMTRGLAWVVGAGASTAAAPVVRGSSTTTRTGGPGESDVTTVDTPVAGLLVRSESYGRGWVAMLSRPNGGPSRKLTVHRLGLLQYVRVPAGRWRVAWVYGPSVASVGAIVSAGFVLAVVLFLVAAVPRRRRARSGAPDDAGDRAEREPGEIGGPAPLARART